MIKRNFIIPEVIQTSDMDCGPASLKSIMEGFGIRAHYGRLREACQTDVDGTSINTLEGLAVDLGMDAEQIMVPSDHLLLKSSQILPALVVIRLPNMATHFVAVWRVHGAYVQIMDPGVGRRWMKTQNLLQMLHQHTMPVSASGWFTWASSEDFTAPLEERLRQLKIKEQGIQLYIEQSVSQENWRVLAALDAATRMLTSLVSARAIKKGAQASGLLEHIWKQASAGLDVIPRHYWSVLCAGETGEHSSQLAFRGAVMIRFRGQRENNDINRDQVCHGNATAASLHRVLAEPAPQTLRRLWGMLCKDGVLTLALLVTAILVAVIGVVFEALLLRGLIDIGQEMRVMPQRLGAGGAVLIFAVALFLIEIPIIGSVLKMGRHLELHFRIALFKKIPRLSDRFFHSRPTSDMAERAHSLHNLRQLPRVAESMLRPAMALVITTSGVIWIDPNTTLPALCAAICALSLPMLTFALLSEKDMQVRTHNGALGRFYLDTLIGLTALHAHSAHKAIYREHERLLTDWARVGYSLRARLMLLEVSQVFIGFSMAVWLLLTHFRASEGTGVALLLAYWALNLPVLGQELGLAMRQYPKLRNHLLRLLEPLSAPEEELVEADKGREIVVDEVPKGLKIYSRHLSVRAAGHDILRDVNLDIDPGQHVAIVGPSGAGKSSLLAVLLGWHTAAEGCLKVDDHEFDAIARTRLRECIAWVDPDVHLWNQSLIDNLSYGADPNDCLPYAQAIDSADLYAVLQHLPEGLQSELGEGGSLLSGGEGQRVRLARAMLKSSVRLALLDEPFRGLEREQRSKLLNTLRTLWASSTLLYVTHDIEDALAFDHVIVVEQARIVEQGKPQDLCKRGSRLQYLLHADRQFRAELLSTERWTRWQSGKGKVEVVS